MTREEFLLARSKGEINFKNLDMVGIDLSNLDLSGCDFRRSDCSGATFENSNLTNCVFVLTRISNTDFSGATLDGCDFELVKNADTAKFVGAMYAGNAIKSAATVDKVGKYQRLVTDQFIQIGCLKGDEAYWKGMNAVKLAAEVDKVSPNEKADAEAWRAAHLAKTITDHETMKKK